MSVARRSPPAASRAGSSLVELLVAITILGVAAVGLAGMALHAGQTAGATAETAQREAALSNLSELVVSTPFGDLPRLAGCEDGAGDAFRYVYCIRVADEHADLREVTVLVDPADDGVPSDSAVILRARGTAATPF